LIYETLRYLSNKSCPWFRREENV